MGQTVVNIVFNPSKAKAVELNQIISSYLTKKGILAVSTSSRDSIVPTPSRDSSSPNRDYYLVTIGGDGTVIRAVKPFLACGGRTVVVTLNTGRLGFMCQYEADEWQGAIDTLIESIGADKGSSLCEARSVLFSECLYGQKVKDAAKPLTAVNEITVRRKTPAALRCKIFVSHTREGEGPGKGVETELYSGLVTDGFVVSTAVGSTAYSLSNGGPIIPPGSSLYCLTFLSTSTFSFKSTLFSPCDTIRAVFDVPEGEDKEVAEIEVDGVVEAVVDSLHSEYAFFKEPREAGPSGEAETYYVQINRRHNFFDVVREKLLSDRTRF